MSGQGHNTVPGADDTGAWREQTSDRMTTLEGEVKTMKSTLELNTTMTANASVKVDGLEKSLGELSESLSGIIKFSKRVDTTLDIGKSFGAFAFWLAKVAAAGAIVWAIVKYIVNEAGK